MANHAQDASASIIPLEVAGHPDADLMAAWDGYKETCLAILALPDGDATGRQGAYDLTEDEFRDRIEQLPALTSAGVVIKLKYIFILNSGTRWAVQAIMQGAPVDKDEMELADEMLLGLIADVERMAAAD